LTTEVGLDPKRLYVSVFIGDEKNNVPRDTDSVEIWKTLFALKGIHAEAVVIGSEADGARLGMQGGRIFFYEAKKNWWSRAGVPEKMPVGEIGGPDSEVFYDFGTPHNPKYGENCHPNCDCGRFLEIGNSVFMQYIKKEDGTFGLLPKQNVDFGGGLERIAAVSMGIDDVFRTDVFEGVIALLEEFSRKKYDDDRYTRSFRIIADHIRAATFMLGDGVRPGNTERSYILRRLIRRAFQHAAKLSVLDKDKGDSMLVRSASMFIESYKNAYPELDGEEAYQTITGEIWKEETQFAHTLDKGLKEFEKIAQGSAIITGEQAFVLFTTFGFPFEMTKELAVERGIGVDDVGFKTHMQRHQDLSRSGSEQKFKGGLADTAVETTRLHTAHHLLLKALQTVLGSHVKQRGSNITQERLRIDFSHGEKMTDEQKKEVERIVNEKIQEGLPVTRSVLPKEKAETLGAEHEFGAKYPDMVSVYSVGPSGAHEENPQFEKAFSIEFCGGPHVQNTHELSESGVFNIQKEEAVAAGVRRIKAVLVR
jgi:alanyl-tRNA synthetase